MRWLDGITDLMDEFDLALGVGDREAWHAVVHVVTKNQTSLSDWAEQEGDKALQFINFTNSTLKLKSQG